VVRADWRLRGPPCPDEAMAFIVRRHRTAAEECIGALRGLASEAETNPLVAVFDGPDARARALAALEAAGAILDHDTASHGSPEVSTSAAITVGRAEVGSRRVTIAGAPRWVVGADGDAVDRASALVGAAPAGAVLVANDAAKLVSDRFDLAPVGDGAFRVLGATAGAANDGLVSAPERRVRTILMTDVVG